MRRIIGFAAILAGVLVGVLGFALTRRDDGLTVAPDDLDLGIVWAQSDFSWTIPVVNRGSTPIEVTDLGSSCGCVSLTPRSFVVPPGGTADVTVTLDLVDRSARRNSEVYEFHVELIAETSAPKQPHLILPLKATVRNPVLFPEDAGQRNRLLLVAGAAHPVRHVECTLATDIVSVSADCDQSYGTARVDYLDGTPAAIAVQIKPSERLSLGDHDFAVWLTPVHRDGSVLPRIPIDVHATVVTDVEALPPVLSYGSVEAGSMQTLELTLASRTGRPFKIASIVCNDPMTQVVAEQTGQSAPSNRRLTIMHRAAVGPQRQMLHVGIEPQDDNEPRYTLAVPIVGVGLSESRIP